MRPIRKPPSLLGADELHPTRDVGVEALRRILEAVDPDRSVDWRRLEALAVYEDPAGGQGWRVLDAAEVQTLLVLLRIDRRDSEHWRAQH